MTPNQQLKLSMQEYINPFNNSYKQVFMRIILSIRMAKYFSLQ